MKSRLINIFFSRPRLEEALRRADVLPGTITASSSRQLSTNWKKRKEGSSSTGRGPSRIDISSEDLCDDIAQRLSTTLTTNKPSIILDLCPGRGVLSTKIHDLIKPDRHIVIEPRLSKYQRYLKKLATKENVEIHGDKLQYEDSHLSGIPWPNLLETYLGDAKPEPGKNDMLVLVNLTVKSFRNPSRMYAALVGHSLIRRGKLNDWNIRTLMTLSADDAEFVIPRSVKNRKKVSILTEAYARQAFVAAETDNTELIMSRQYELAAASDQAVARRAAENGIPPTPENRMRPAAGSLTEVSAGFKSTSTPYVSKTPVYAGYIAGQFSETQKLHDKAFERDPKSAEYKKLRVKLSAARAQLMHHVKSVDESVAYAKRQLEVDSMERALVEARLSSKTEPPADAVKTVAKLNEMNNALVEARKELSNTFAKAVIIVSRTLPNYIDEYRIALGATGDMKDSDFLWDHRPFEPVHIRPDEVHPKGSNCSLLYIEPEAKETLAERFAIDEAHDRPDEAVEIALSVIGAFGIRGRQSLADMLEKLLPGQTFNEVIKLVPELFPYVPKQLLLPSSATATTTVTDSSESSSSSTSIYDDFEYFPQQVGLRSLPTSVLLKLLKAYLQSANQKSFLQVNRSLGGSATMYALRSWVFDIHSKD